MAHCKHNRSYDLADEHLPGGGLFQDAPDDRTLERMVEFSGAFLPITFVDAIQ